MNRLASRIRSSRPWMIYKRARLHRQYAKRRDGYAAEADRRGVRYDERAVIDNLRARLLDQRRLPLERVFGAVHTFAFVADIGWHHQMLGDLGLLGPVTLFDYRSLDFPRGFFLQPDGDRLRAELNRRLLDAVRATHRTQSIDMFFSYAHGGEILADTVEAVRELGVPTVNMCLDDKQSWEGRLVGRQRIGQIDIAAAYDLAWTSSRVACEWYLLEGGNPVYMPEAFDASTYRPLSAPRDIPVSFVGEAYGFRPALVDYLRSKGIPLEAFGPGWGIRSFANDPNAVFNRSLINLGMGGIGYSESLTNVKGRDFDVPGAGGGMYLTTFNADLAQHFDIGREIACYQSRDELVEMLRYYLSHEEEAAAMAKRARARSLSEHRWVHRFVKLGELLGLLAERQPSREAD